jgi:hypothetical protein
MKYTIIFCLCFFLFNSTAFSQNELNSVKAQLAGTDRIKWVFEKLERTMGDRKAVKDTKCGNAKFATIILEIQGSRYFASSCKDTTTTKGNWILKEKGFETFTLTLDQEYDVDIYTRTSGKTQRKYMRLRIPGIKINQPSIEITYYAQ